VPRYRESHGGSELLARAAKICDTLEHLDIFLRPLNSLVERKRQRLERIRILDLGCDGGDGYDLLMDSSYGTLSHFHDYQCVNIISDICKHAPERAIFVSDWLGRYSYEWQDLWHHPVSRLNANEFASAGRGDSGPDTALGRRLTAIRGSAARQYAPCRTLSTPRPPQPKRVWSERPG